MRHVFAFAALISAAAVARADDATCWLRDGSSPAPSVVYLLCEQGPIKVTTDGGATWISRNTGATGHLRNIEFIDARHGFAVGDEGLLLATSDGGRKWEARKTGAKENLAAIQFVGQSGWVVGFDGVILHSADGGATWDQQQTGTKESLEGLFFLDNQRGWVVGWAGTILRTADGGKTWQMIRSDAAQWSLSSVWFQDPNNGWAVGFGGQILRTHDGGATWATLKSPVQSWLSSVAFDRGKRGWIAADDAVLLSEDGGETWRPIRVENRLFISQLVPVGDSLWAVGQLGVLRQTGATGWKKIENLVTDDVTQDTDSAAVTPSPAK